MDQEGCAASSTLNSRARQTQLRIPPRDTASNRIANSIIDEVKWCPVRRVKVHRFVAGRVDKLSETVKPVVRSCAK